jgi:5-methylcytosine-specific restriction endonuclease McrA
MVERVAVRGMSPKGDKRNYADRREYLISAVQKRRKKIRQMAVEYKGGRCSICGYSRCVEALEFHHLDPQSKDFGISDKGYTRSWKKVKEELDRCVILCANCHREVHAGLQLPRVTAVDKLGEFKET